MEKYVVLKFEIRIFLMNKVDNFLPDSAGLL